MQRHVEATSIQKKKESIVSCSISGDKVEVTGYKSGLYNEKLKGEELDPRLEIAAGIRTGEKRVLRRIDEVLKQGESELDELEYYQERRLEDLGLVVEQGEITLLGFQVETASNVTGTITFRTPFMGFSRRTPLAVRMNIS